MLDTLLPFAGPLLAAVLAVLNYSPPSRKGIRVGIAIPLVLASAVISYVQSARTGSYINTNIEFRMFPTEGQEGYLHPGVLRYVIDAIPRGNPARNLRFFANAVIVSGDADVVAQPVWDDFMYRVRRGEIAGAPHDTPKDRDHFGIAQVDVTAAQLSEVILGRAHLFQTIYATWDNVSGSQSYAVVCGYFRLTQHVEGLAIGSSPITHDCKARLDIKDETKPTHSPS